MCLVCKYSYKEKQHQQESWILKYSKLISGLVAIIVVFLAIYIIGYILTNYCSCYAVPMSFDELLDVIIAAFTKDTTTEVVKMKLCMSQNTSEWNFMEALKQGPWLWFQCSTYYRLVISGVIAVGLIGLHYYHLRVILVFLDQPPPPGIVFVMSMLVAMQFLSCVGYFPVIEAIRFPVFITGGCILFTILIAEEFQTFVTARLQPKMEVEMYSKK